MIVAIQGHAQKLDISSLPFSVQDSLKKIAKTEDQRIEAIVYFNMGSYYWLSKGDSAMLYLSKAEKIAKENNFIDLLPRIYYNFVIVDNIVLGNYPMGLYHGFEQLKYITLMQDRPKISGEDVYSRNIYPAYLNIANSYALLGNTEKANEYINKIPQDIYIPEKFDKFLHGQIGYESGKWIAKIVVVRVGGSLNEWISGYFEASVRGQKYQEA